MLFLLFELDRDRYALEAASIAEVRALTAAKAIPGAPAWVAGVVERRGEPVPVIDVAQLALGRASQPLRSTRIVFVQYRAADGQPRVLGLIVEHATQTRRIGRERFADSGVTLPDARWLGPVARDEFGLIQWIDVQNMLDDDVKALLFTAAPVQSQTQTQSQTQPV
jgi:chemotaxis-related protein WspB